MNLYRVTLHFEFYNGEEYDGNMEILSYSFGGAKQYVLNYIEQSFKFWDKDLHDVEIIACEQLYHTYDFSKEYYERVVWADDKVINALAGNY